MSEAALLGDAPDQADRQPRQFSPERQLGTGAGAGVSHESPGPGLKQGCGDGNGAGEQGTPANSGSSVSKLQVAGGERAPTNAAAPGAPPNATAAAAPASGMYLRNSIELGAVAAPAEAAAATANADPASGGRATGGDLYPTLCQQRSPSSKRHPEVWGWLRPAPGTRLPFVLLQGRSVAIGRGRDAYHERLPQLVAALSCTASLHTPALPSFGAAFSGSLGSSGLGSSTLDGASPFAAVAASGSGSSAFSSGASGDRDRESTREEGASPRAWDGTKAGSSFVEVPDGRVSRLHTWVKWDGKRQEAVLEDLSSNGTFRNGQRVGHGRSVVLADGDRISLVLSVAPLAEQAFIYHKGDPRGQEGAAAAEWGNDTGAVWLQRQISQRSPSSALDSSSAAAVVVVPLGGASDVALSRPASALTRSSNSSSASAAAAAARRLSRCQTSQYSTPQAITLEDLQCQICLSTLRDCVALEPCGHNFCATCLSHHLAALLAGGQPLSCPLRCAPPERVVINAAVRQLLSAASSGTLLSPITSSRQLRHQQSVQQHGGTLEVLPEVLTSGSSSGTGGSGGSLRLAPDCRMSSLISAPSASTSDSQGIVQLSHCHQQQGFGDIAGYSNALTSTALSGTGSDGGTSGGGYGATSPQGYRHVQLQISSDSNSSLALPPTSPFESQAFASGLSRTQQIEEPAVEQAWALPGVPTLAAEVPLMRCQSLMASSVVASGVLPGTSVVPAANPLPRVASEGPTGSCASNLCSPANGQPAAGAAPLPAGPLVANEVGSGGSSQLPAAALLALAASEVEAEAPTPMHPLCPLHDAVLPLDTAGLKSRQLTHSLELLRSVQDSEDDTMSHLEAIARLAWSDEAARQELGALDGVRAIVGCLRQHLASEGVQCNGCLALMALVRGEGEASDANRLRLADCGGVEVIAEGMYVHSQSPMVQLSGLLCLVPLALENTYLQVLVARCCLPVILAAMQHHLGEVEVVSKAMIMLGVLGQGEEEAHEVIRQAIMERTSFPRIAALVLSEMGTTSEDVLWSALFALAVIARDTSASYVSHLLRLAAAGVLPALEAALTSYRGVVGEQGGEADEMILRAGDFLVSVLHTACKQLWIRRTRRLMRLALVGMVAVAALRWLRQRGGHHRGGGGRRQ